MRAEDRRAARDLAAALKTMWQRLRWDNRALELLRRLPLNGVAGAGGTSCLLARALVGGGRRWTARNRLTFGARMPSGI
eukprot:294755-Chlamydomonas_euryale.AAC.1